MTNLYEWFNPSLKNSSTCTFYILYENILTREYGHGFSYLLDAQRLTLTITKEDAKPVCVATVFKMNDIANLGSLEPTFYC